MRAANRDEGEKETKGKRKKKAEREKERIDDTKTAIPTFRPCTELPGRIREYRVRTYHRGERLLAVLHASWTREEEEGIDGLECISRYAADSRCTRKKGCLCRERGGSPPSPRIDPRYAIITSYCFGIVQVSFKDSRGWFE